MNECQRCGAPIAQHPGVTPATMRHYCSGACKQAAFYARHGGVYAYKLTRRAAGAVW